MEVGEVDVGLVKQGDFAVLQTGAEGHRTGVVVVTGFLDDGKAGQKALEVESQVEFGGGFAAAVLGPVHAVGH